VTPGRPTADRVDWSLYLVTDPELGGGRDAVAGIVEEAVAGGAGVVQLRDKTLDDDAFADRAAELADVLTGTGVPLFVNDRIDVACRLGLHLHIGQDDIDVRTARSRLPDHLMLGLSVDDHTQIDALRERMADGMRPPDVLGLGPVELTPTKPDTGRALGVTGPGSVDELAVHALELGIPSVAIGGVSAANAAALGRTSVAGICVVSAVMAADDPAAVAGDLRTLFTHTDQKDPA
jgi:thiamine-phosphate pyrophosphorylase